MHADRGQLHEINEYLERQGAYDLMDSLLKDLLIKQPVDPIQHLLEMLKSPWSTGPLKVIVTSPPCIGRSRFSRAVAERFGLQFISVGEMLRSSGVQTEKIDLSEDDQVARLVFERLAEAEKDLKGWVLDGFPRTRYQATLLKQHAIVPTHVLALKASEDEIRSYVHHMNEEGDDVPIAEKVLDAKLRLYLRHVSTLLEDYSDKISVVPFSNDEAAVVEAMVTAVQTRHRSSGPVPPVRVVITGPRGGNARELSSRLSAHLDAVFVDAEALQTQGGLAQLPLDLKRAAEKDPLGVVGARLRQSDCVRQGWLLYGYPSTVTEATLLQKDEHLVPLRVIALDAVTDSLTSTLEVLGQRDGRCLSLSTQTSLEEVYRQMVEFVQRPLPLQLTV